jgi:hypothetical protein
VKAALENGYISGYPDGTFQPNRAVSRAEFAKMINSAMNYTNQQGVLTYNDVPTNAWYYYDVRTITRAGYMQGDGNGLFRPDASITRQEVAVVLDRVSPGGSTSYNSTGIIDINSVASWALNSVRAMYNKGIFNGDTYGYFNPNAPLSRSEAVKAINIMIGISPTYNGNYNTDVGVGLVNQTISLTDILLERYSNYILTVNYRSSHDGTLYYVVLPDTARAPSASQIISGVGYYNESPVTYGSRSVIANQYSSFNTKSITTYTDYEIYMVVRNSAGNYSQIEHRMFNLDYLYDDQIGDYWLSKLDVTVSKVSTGAQTASVVITTQADVAGTFYYVIVDDYYGNISTPSQSQIRNGRDASNNSAYQTGSVSLTAKSSRTINVSGLVPGTRYTVFGTLYNTDSSLSNYYYRYSNVLWNSFTTDGETKDWVTSVSIPVETIEDTYATMRVRSNKTGTFYYVVDPGNYGKPSVSDIESGRIKSGTYAYTAGHIELGTVNEYASVKIEALKDNTTYYVYGVLKSGSEWSLVTSLVTFRTVNPANRSAPLTKLDLSFTSGSAITVGTSHGYRFDGGIRDYDITLPFTASKLRINAESEVGAIFINRTRAGELSVVKDMTLTVGSNVIYVDVREDGKDINTYTLNVVREKQPVVDNGGGNSGDNGGNTGGNGDNSGNIVNPGSVLTSVRFDNASLDMTVSNPSGTTQISGVADNAYINVTAVFTSSETVKMIYKGTTWILTSGRGQQIYRVDSLNPYMTISIGNTATYTFRFMFD